MKLKNNLETKGVEGDRELSRKLRKALVDYGVKGDVHKAKSPTTSWTR